jgi:hypothetical protein
MRSILTSLFIFAASCLFGQSSEKGCFYNSFFKLEVYHADGTGETIKYLSTFLPGPSVSMADTIRYVLEDQDSVVADFELSDNFIQGGYDPTWPFLEQLIYGDPVYDWMYQYQSNSNYYRRIWTFKDSAMFSFTTRFNGSPSHVIKLIKKPAPPAVVEEVEEAVNPLIAVFPNPTTTDIFVQLPDGFPAALSLTDAAGRLVKVWNADGSHTVDLSAFQSGSYMLRITGNGQISSFRIQKI